MDELRGPSIQIVLHVKEGLGFGFLRTPFIVSGSLNGYILETDPTVPTHAPIFDAELVWEADKRRFRSLRVQNVPVKVEVFSLGTQGKKDKIGYLLLSLLGAQPCPSNKIVDVKHAWHRLLGVRSEGKCCHPQLLLSLTVEDRLSTPTPRNELRMFHSNEVAYPRLHSTTNTLSGKSVLLTLKEYIAESKKTVSSRDLEPHLVSEEGLIQIGSGKQLFVLSLTIASVENLDLLLPDTMDIRETVHCCVTYSVFTHNIMTDRVGVSTAGSVPAAQFNQRTWLRLRAALGALTRYFAECPHLVIKVCAGDKDIGICSVDLRKLVPTDDLTQFLNKFCNKDRALSISERCYILRCEGGLREQARRPFVDIEISLKFVGMQTERQKPCNLTARSATQLETNRKVPEQDPVLECKSGSCAHFDQEVGGVAYTNVARSTDRYTNASGDAVLQTNEIAEMIKKMCESFAQSQEKLLASRFRPMTSDMQVQCDAEDGQTDKKEGSTDNVSRKEDENVRTDDKFAGEGRVTAREVLSQRLIVEDITSRDDNGIQRDPIRIETSKSDSCINHSEKDMVKQLISAADRDAILQKFVDELEDWKEKQQQLFTCQLKRKEDYHLELLAKEWAKKRTELECKLSKGIEQCRNLAADLSRATDDFRLRGYRNTEREKKLIEAKKSLEAHYTAKFQELRAASQRMEADMRHQLTGRDSRIEELEQKVAQLEKQIDVLKTNLKNNEKDAESRYSGLTKDQTASLIQELRCLEEKLDTAVQSKSFFKEQWGRCVRELHQLKLTQRRLLLDRLRRDRSRLKEQGLDPISDEDEKLLMENDVDLKKLKDDFYVDLLANTPGLDTNSILSNCGPGGMEMFEDLKTAPKNPLSEKLSSLISQREQLIQAESPDEEELRQLNQHIRSLLLHCGT
ncbi:uncharacterized protein LOC106129089 [Amyelois transitella]|uniref:uncharacterized protein LOC106129089 n=1 Tax=Amyelois transitella TaxID=680683 RepID=UPI00299057AF|nr:uncharacterized protein LOC106129089 [Amyelois transitella]